MSPPALTATTTTTTTTSAPTAAYLASASSSAMPAPVTTTTASLSTPVQSFNIQLGYRLLRFVAAFVVATFSLSFGAVYAFSHLQSSPLPLPLCLLRATILFSGIFAVTAAHAASFAEKKPLPPPRLSWVFLAALQPRALATSAAFAYCAIAIPFALNLFSKSSFALILRIAVSAATFQFLSTALRPCAAVPPFADFAQWRSALLLEDPYFAQSAASFASSTAFLSAVSTVIPHLVVATAFISFGVFPQWPAVTQVLAIFSALFVAGAIAAVTSKYANVAIVSTKPVSHSNLELIQVADPDKGAITRHHALWELATSGTANPLRREQVYNDQPTKKSWTNIQAPLLSYLTTFAEQVTMFDLPLRKQPQPVSPQAPSARQPTLSQNTFNTLALAPDSAQPPTFSGPSGSVSHLFYRGPPSHSVQAPVATVGTQPISTLSSPGTPAVFAWPAPQPAGSTAASSIPARPTDVTATGVNGATKATVPPTWIQGAWSKLSAQVLRRLGHTQAAATLGRVHLWAKAAVNDMLLAFRLAALTVHFQLVAWCAVAMSRLVVHSYVQDPYGLVFPDLAKIVPVMLRVLRTIQDVQRATPQWNWKRFEQDFVVRERVKEWRAIASNSAPGTKAWNMDEVETSFPFCLDRFAARQPLPRVNEWAYPEMVAEMRLVFVFEVCAAALGAMYVRYERYICEVVAPKLSEEDRALLCRLMAQ